MKQFIKNFLIGLCLAPIAIVIACVMILPIFIMMYVHSGCIQGRATTVSIYGFIICRHCVDY